MTDQSALAFNLVRSPVMDSWPVSLQSPGRRGELMKQTEQCKLYFEVWIIVKTPEYNVVNAFFPVEATV